MDENLLLSLIENNAKMEVVDLAAALNETEENVDKTIKDLEKNYILSDYEITIEDDYKEFQKVLDDLNDVTEIIESKDFSYQDMIENFERITINSKPFNDSLIKHNELAESLKIQEKMIICNTVKQCRKF